MTRSAGIISAGRIYCDLVFSGLDAPPGPGREVFADQLKLCAGGGAYITSAYLSALGETVSLMGMLPAAPFGGVVINEMRQNGVGSSCQMAEGTDVQLTAALVTGADRAFITRRVGPAIAAASIEAMQPARHLHIGELTTLLEHPELVARARALGTTISLDCGWDEATLSRRDLAQHIAQVDIFLPNEAEAAALASQGVDLRPILMTVIKQGDKGATCLQASGGKPVHSPALPARLVDTTGAGDAFNAGFLSAWLSGRSIADALTLGNACGATAIARMGGAGALPDLRSLMQEIDRALPEQAAQ